MGAWLEEGRVELRRAAVWFGHVLDDGRIEPIERDVDVLTEHVLQIGGCPPLPFSMSERAIESGLFSRQEYYSLLKQVATRLASHAIRTSIPEDWEVVRAIDCLDELTRCLNVLGEKRREVEETGALAEEVPCWMEHITMSVDTLSRERSLLIEGVERAVRRCAPNTAEVATSLIGARLIAEAGGLRELAMLPASSIQVLGAKRALFRHLRGRAPSPKHGVLYSHPALARAPRKMRGKIARLLASRIAIAARLDYFRGTLDEEFVSDFREKLKERGIEL
ncbi:MAG: nucleolar protein 56 [Methanosarcinales archaeon]|uniref:hypothetical protein n=1 Tax=Methermicoccus shengliensis TaxID=660064 RepID=UPI00069378C2|nr:hypothetical protein [Methermicoccus shengliensis]MDI3488066.1 nucleolar protein 56 [Methanosarcinales archaeon]MDN5295687.1 nucleolar protein 56 [Methanosarcinales archaeon]